MDLRQRTKRFGFYIILCAFLLRLTAEGILQKGFLRLLQRDSVPIHIYSETGRNVRFSASSADFSFHFRESPPPWLPDAEKICFSAEDAQLVELYNTSSKRPELESLLLQPLDWALAAAEPTVLILHTHGTESYTPDGETYAATSSYRTLDENHNMLSIGDAVTKILEENGIGVIHDRTVYDYPSYNGSYTLARAAISEHLRNNPSLCLVLDLHRDASGTTARQLRTEAVIDGKTAAQLMLVMGTNHDRWEENLSLALKFHALMQQRAPGIMRPINLRGQRFNQDLSPGALLIEVGAAGNTRQEALHAARILGDAVVSLAKGCR